jgi:hypothetical protein
MKIKQSESVVIKRSQINFADYNPRKESKKVIEALKKNFKKVGYLGGVVWNKQTGNIVSGHKRIQTMDLVYDYPQNDYDVKVEQIDVDLQSEKEQNIFMNAADSQGEFDFTKLAEMIPDINIEFSGLADETIEMIKFEVPSFVFGNADEAKEDFKTLKDKGLSEEELKEARKAKRAKRTQMSVDMNAMRNEKNYLIVTFDNMEDKAYICEILNIKTEDRYITALKAFKDLF